ncbi:MAG: SprT family zinc-dependent metalloprotease [Balneolaceae bacterium]
MRSTSTQITVEGIPIEVTRKRVKHLRVVVYRSSGRVRISSPKRVEDQEIFRFAQSKIQWIRKHLLTKQKVVKMPDQPIKTGTIHHVWGETFELNIIEKNAPPNVVLNGSNTIELFVRPGSDQQKKEKVMREWYREQIKKEIPALIKKWEPIMGVKVNDWGVKKMKTRWGTCNVRAKRIWLSLDLAKRSPEFLEYIVVHEMTHILERLHSPRFYGLMDRFMPGWREVDQKLGGRHWKKEGDFK